MRPITTVDIVIPTFNRAPLIRRAVEAALGQHYSDCSVIVIDDGSTDDTAGAMQELLAHPRLCYVRLSQNVGAAHAKNAGLLLGAGDAITFHDSDDVPYPQKVMVQHRTLSVLKPHRSEVFDWSHCEPAHEGGFDVALSGYKLFKEDGREFLIDSPLSLFDDFFPNVQARAPVEGDWILINCGLFRRTVFERLGGFEDHVEEDRELRNRLLSAGCSVSFIKEPLLDKIEMPGSLTLDANSGYHGPKRERARAALAERVRQIRGGVWGAAACEAFKTPIELPEVTAVAVSRPELLARSVGVPANQNAYRFFESAVTSDRHPSQINSAGALSGAR